MEPKISFDFETTHLIIQKISFIDSFKGEWNVIIENENPQLEALTHEALAFGSAAAARLDGPAISDTDTQAMLADPGALSAPTKQQAKVLGVFEANKFVRKHFKELPLSEETLFHLHKLLLKYTDTEDTFKGKYKSTPNKEISDDPKFEHQLFYNTTVRFIVHKEINELLDWIDRSLKENKIHPLILTAWFIYELLSIHPFQYANGRLAKVLTTMLLLKSKYHFIRYLPIEQILEERKADYFGVLIEGQRHRRRYTEREKISDWIIFFMECVEQAIQKLDAVHRTIAAEQKAKAPLSTKSSLGVLAPVKESGIQEKMEDMTSSEVKHAVYLNDRQKKIMEYVTICGPVKIGDITREFPAISRNTIKKDLLHFQKSALTNQIGRGRGTYYTAKK